MVIQTGEPHPNPPKASSGGSSGNVDYGKKYAEDLKKTKKMEEKAKNGKFPLLRKISIVQSFLLIVIAAIGMFGCAINDKDTTERAVILTLLSVFIVGQIFNVIVHWIDPSYQTTTWLGLFIVRKKLEEKNKIEAMSVKK